MTITLPWRWTSFLGGPPLFSSITDDEIEHLQELAAVSERALEVGSAYGFSAIAMALAGAHVTAIDPHAGELPDSLPEMVANLRAYGVTEKVEIIKSYSQQALPGLPEYGFDLMFIDGDHREPAVTHDVTQGKWLVRPGGFLACHDYGETSCPGVKTALDKIFPQGPTRLVNTLFVVQL